MQKENRVTLRRPYRPETMRKLRALYAKFGPAAVCTAACALLAACRPAAGLAPFAVCLPGIFIDSPLALFAAVGSAAAAVVLEPSLYSLTAWCIPVLLYFFCVRLLKHKNLTAMPWRMGALVLCSGIGLACSPEARMYDILMAALSCIGGCALLPLLSGALSAFDSLGKHSALTRGELACLAVPVCGVLLSLPFEGFMGISPAQLCALFCISVCSLSLPSGGAAFSGICAALFLLKGQTPAAGLAMVIMSLLAYALRRISRVGVLLGYIAGDFFASLLIAGSFVPLIPIQTAILSALPALFFNKRRLELLRGLGGSVLIPTSSEKELAARSAFEADRRIKGCAEVFNRLSQIFCEEKENKRSKRLELCSHAASRVCSQCSKYDYCWRMRYCDTYSDFKALAGMICAAGSVSPYDVSKDFKARCADWIGVLLDMNAQNALPGEQSHEQKGNMMMSRQCRSIADLLTDLVNQRNTVQYDFDAEERLSAVLCENGIGAKDIVCRCNKGGLESVSLSLSACRGDKPCLNLLPELLKRAFNCDFACDERNCSLENGGCSCVFTPVPRLSARCHAACKIKNGQNVCGDSFSLMPLPGGKYLAALSDGMGSGSQAACESENAVALLETLCLGRMEVRQAYDTVNELLQLRRKSAEVFSTMDACILDLSRGICSWGKIGAVPGYLVRSGRVTTVTGSALPLGVLSDPEPSISDRVIKEGDLLVLLSDGIYDALTDSCQDGIALMLPELCRGDVSFIAGELVRRALAKSDGTARDDMTAIAIRITAA